MEIGLVLLLLFGAFLAGRVWQWVVNARDVMGSWRRTGGRRR